MFLNRASELEQLERWWDGNAPELITLYGRRQVGKTELLVHFLDGKPAIYFYADRQVAGDHLRAFTEQVLTNPSGFAGIDGIFRFRRDGTNERGLAVLRVAPGGGQVVSPAPKSFASGA